MNLTNIPGDISAECLYNYLRALPCEVSLRGPHKRNTYQDIASVEESASGGILLNISRKGLYDMLPEGMFHPLNRFDNLSANDYENLFLEECRKQEEEENNARRFLKPVDIFLFGLRCVLARAKEEFSGTSVLIDLLCDSLSKEQRENRFVRHALRYIPQCKSIRGDRTLISLMLRQIFMAEGLELTESLDVMEVKDAKPRYICEIESADDGLDPVFLGNEFEETVLTYTVTLWDEDECNEHFEDFIKDLNVFQHFLNEWFVGIEEHLQFSVVADYPALRLSDDLIFNYLNYNTNL